jgi:phosphopantothenoylcysteine decarboxylase/phosphopantothenate--cysteine ligase
MVRILLTSGPTRQYLDPVRYLSNASSGRMGAALAVAAIEAGHEVTIVSGPVEIEYPAAAEVVRVVSTEEMLEACRSLWARCDGLIGAAAPCDYRPQQVAPQKLSKTGGPRVLDLVETPDILATLAAEKTSQWMVAFALETEDARLRAMQKLARKKCDLIVLNGPAAIQAADTRVEIIDRAGDVVGQFAGSKLEVARGIFRVLKERLISSAGSRGDRRDAHVRRP